MNILDVDLLAYENGSEAQRSAVVDGVMRSLGTGFVYVENDISSDLLDTAYAQLEAFFALSKEQKDSYVVPGSNGQAGYTGLLVETAATSEVPDWKEMINWGSGAPEGHPLRDRYPHRYRPPVLPEADLPGVHDILMEFHNSIVDLQTRFLRIIAVGLGAHESFFDTMVTNGATLTRAIHYPSMKDAPGGEHVWAGAHADINLITALPRATAKGLQVETEDGWVDAIPPEGRAIINSGMMLELISNAVIKAGVHRVVADADNPGDRYSVVQFCHPTPWTILSPIPTCVTPDNPLRFSSLASADRLDEVLWEINLVEDARRVS